MRYFAALPDNPDLTILPRRPLAYNNEGDMSDAGIKGGEFQAFAGS